MNNKNNGAREDANSFNNRKFRQDKYSNFRAEIKAVRAYLSDHNATATMVAIALDIYRPNLCRYKLALEQAGLLVETHKGICKETGWPANYLTTNPEIIKKLKNGGSDEEA